MANNVVVELPRTLAVADLARSGLDESDLKTLQITALTAEETYSLVKSRSSYDASRFRARSYIIPYTDIATGKPNGFFRLRFLDDVRRRDGDLIRYWQPSDDVRAYFPPGIDWARVAVDPTVEVWVTEGEKKAAAAAKAGVAMIGLGGVDNWRSRRKRQSLIPDLLQFAWKGRRVRVVFDHDPAPKPHVAGTREALCHALDVAGADAYVVDLPANRADPDAKVGVDDFLVAHDGRGDALTGLEASKSVSGGALLALNDELVLLESPTAVLHLATKQLLTERTLGLLYANRTIKGLDAAGRFVELAAADEWLKWPHRRVARGLAYEPGAPIALPDGRLNLYRPGSIVAKRGDVSPFKKLFDHVATNLDATTKKWLLAWLAYPIARPGTKLYTAVILVSREQGTGKSLIGETVGRVYGEDNFARVGTDELHSAFNDWLAEKQFILGDEVTGSDKRTDADRLKRLVTSESVEVNRKFQPRYTLRATANFLFTTNHPNAFLLDETDRRFLVVEVPVPDAFTAEWMRRAYDPWYRSDVGTAALAYFLEHVDISGFDPHAPAPATTAKTDMVELSGSDADLVARTLIAAPDLYLRIPGTTVSIAKDLFTLDELIAILDPDGKRRLSRIGFAHALRRAGVRRLERTRTPSGLIWLWPIRNHDKWHKANHAARVAEWNRGAGAEEATTKPAKF